jgi:predicted ATPase
MEIVCLNMYLHIILIGSVSPPWLPPRRHIEVQRIRGELLLLKNEPSTAQEYFLQALDWARRQDALSWELRAATSVARLWHRQHRTAQARMLLAPVYARFTQGFGTADLIAARSLLASLR